MEEPQPSEDSSVRSSNHKSTGRVAREQRQETAAARTQAREARSAQEQVEALDQRLGTGVGAERERARLVTA
jgi:hypothetical protein